MERMSNITGNSILISSFELVLHDTLTPRQDGVLDSGVPARKPSSYSTLLELQRRNFGCIGLSLRISNRRALIDSWKILTKQLIHSAGATRSQKERELGVCFHFRSSYRRQKAWTPAGTTPASDPTAVKLHKQGKQAIQDIYERTTARQTCYHLPNAPVHFDARWAHYTLTTRTLQSRNETARRRRRHDDDTASTQLSIDNIIHEKPKQH